MSRKRKEIVLFLRLVPLFTWAPTKFVEWKHLQLPAKMSSQRGVLRMRPSDVFSSSSSTAVQAKIDITFKFDLALKLNTIIINKNRVWEGRSGGEQKMRRKRQPLQDNLPFIWRSKIPRKHYQTPNWKIRNKLANLFWSFSQQIFFPSNLSLGFLSFHPPPELGSPPFFQFFIQFITLPFLGFGVWCF